MKGFVNIQRLLADHWVWRNSILGHHWVDLIMFAEYEEKSVYFGGQQVLLKRGQQVTTTRLLMARWNTNPKMVLKTLEIFEKEKMIKCVKNNRMTIITLRNYDKHQAGLAAILGPNTDDISDNISAKKLSKRKRDGKQTKEENNTTIKKDKQIIVVDEKERQKIVSEVFFSEEKIKEGCELFKITPQKYKELANEVLKEWKFGNEQDWSVEHFKNAMRVKHNISNSKNEKLVEANENAKENKPNNGRAGAGQVSRRNPLERVSIRGSEKNPDKS